MYLRDFGPKLWERPSVNDNLEKAHLSYVKNRLSGSFGEIGSWPLVLPFLKGRRTLDLGCSDGLYLQHLSAESVGIELSPELAHAAQKKGLTVTNANVMDGLKQQSTSAYEAVLFSHVMEHIDSPVAALWEIHRVLEKGGVLVLGLPLENCFVRQALRQDYFGGTHIYAFTVRNATKLLSVAHLSVNKVLYQLPHYKGTFGRWVNTVWNYLPFPFKKYFSAAYWVIATKEE